MFLVTACGRPSKSADRNPPASSSIADAGAHPVDGVVLAMADARPYVRDEEVWEYLGRYSGEHGQGTGEAEKWLLAHPDRARPELLRFVGQTWWNLITDDAYWLLGEIGWEEDVPVLRAVLLSPEEHDRHYTAMALARMPHESAFQALEDGTASSDPDIVGTSIFALGKRGDQRARQTIEAHLGDDDVAVRNVSIHALSELGVEPSRAALEARQKVETNKDVLSKLATALGTKTAP